MIQKIVALGFCLFLITACQTRKQNHDADYFILTGNFRNAGHISLQLQELTTNEVIPIDSFKTNADGYFSYRGMIGESSFFIIRIDQDNFITLLIEPGEEIFIDGDAENLSKNYSVKGSEGSKLLSVLYRSLNCNQMLLDSLSTVYVTMRNTENFNQIKKELDKAYEKILKKQKQYVKHFIQKNPKSLASIIALYQSFGNQLLLNEQDHFDYFESLSNSLSDVYPTNKHVLYLHRKVSQYKLNELRRNMLYDKLAVGSRAPEIVLPDPDGRMLPLSSFRGNYVLIDFWASWCTPCRKTNLKLRQIYNKYNDQGFEIYGISLDKTHDQWVRVIAEDSISWTQVSDLRLWNSPVVSLYNVRRIPYSILIDPDGTIINKGIEVHELADCLAVAFDN